MLDPLAIPVAEKPLARPGMKERDPGASAQRRRNPGGVEEVEPQDALAATAAPPPAAAKAASFKGAAKPAAKPGATPAAPAAAPAQASAPAAAPQAAAPAATAAPAPAQSSEKAPANSLRKVLEADPAFAADYCRTIAYAPDVLCLQRDQHNPDTYRYADGSPFGEDSFPQRMTSRLQEVYRQRAALYESALARGLNPMQTFYLLSRFNERLPDDYKLATSFPA